MWNRIKELLGLADYEDEYYEDEYDEHEDAEDAEDDEVDLSEPFGRRLSEPYRSPYAERPKSVRRVEREPDVDRAREAAPARGGPHVRMHIVEPKSFNEAQQIADRFKEGVPVIMNLSGTDPEPSKRLLDFTSGLTYGLEGGLRKVSDRVFMLTPENVDVSAEQRRRLRDEGLFTMDT